MNTTNNRPIGGGDYTNSCTQSHNALESIPASTLQRSCDNTNIGFHKSPKATFFNYFIPRGTIKHDWQLLFVIYAFAFGLMLLNTKGYYWDDWALIGNFSFESMNKQFLENGNVWYGYFEWIFISLQPYGIPLFRVFTFLSFFICGLCVYHIAKSLYILKTYELFFIVVFFLVLPFNTISRNILINAPYTLCYLLFFLAFLLVSMKSTKYISLRILILILFFFSFTMNSLLVFYSLPILYMLYAQKAYKSLKHLWSWVIKNLDFVILPIGFYAIKIIFFKPYGLYEGYNAVSISGVLKAFIKTPIISVLQLSHTSFILLGTLCISALIVGLIILIYRLKHKLLAQRDIIGIGLGFMIMWAGMFSYVVVFKYSLINTVADRFSILESLGAGIIVVFFINTLTKNLNYKIWILSFFTLCAIHYNIISQQRVFLAYVKQVGVFEHLMQNPIFLSYDTFRIYDSKKNIWDNAFYQLNGIYKKLSNKSDKLISLEEESLDIQELVKYCKAGEVYNCWEYNGDANSYAKIYIIDKSSDLENLYNFLGILRLYMLNLFNPSSFKEKAYNRYQVYVFAPAP